MNKQSLIYQVISAVLSVYVLVISPAANYNADLSKVNGMVVDQMPPISVSYTEPLEVLRINPSPLQYHGSLDFKCAGSIETVYQAHSGSIRIHKKVMDEILANILHPGRSVLFRSLQI